MNENNIYNSIIGSGPLFPIELTTNELGQTGWYPVSGDTRLIENNLESLMIHQIGQKLRGEDFGTRLWECIEEGNTQAQSFLVNAFMKDAISTWEDRITYKSTTITREGSRIILRFHYVINGTSSSNVGTLIYDPLNNTLNT